MNKTTDTTYIAVARRLAAENDRLSVDTGAEVVRVSEGAYVLAHIWVPDTDLGGTP